MGYAVIAFCSVDFEGKVNTDSIKKLIKKHGGKNIRFYDNGLEFELIGNRGVDYEVMETLKKKLKVQRFEISTSEFAETGEGYYYDSEEGD